MRNLEFYEEKILAIINDNDNIAVRDGEPYKCDCVSCDDCDFNGSCCSASALNWLYAEHVEKPKISKRTKMFFEAIETGWVARDESGGLYLYGISNKPVKGTVTWESTDIRFDNSIVPLGVFSFLTLDFIKWTDEEPWSVEDVLKLEVEV